MSTEVITGNDLKAILNEVLPPTPSEYRKLLWTNPNPTSTFAAQTIIVPDISEYDDLEFDIRGGSGSTFSCFSAKYPVDLLRTHGEVWLLNPAQGATNLPSVNGRKMTFTSDTQVSFSTGAYWNTSGYNTGSENSGVPIRIYGIKYGRVAEPMISQMVIQTYTGTNCSAKYVHIGNIVVAYLTQSANSVNYAGLPKPIQASPYMYGMGAVFRDTDQGGAATAEGYSDANGIHINILGGTSGHNYVSCIVYLTDEVA